MCSNNGSTDIYPSKAVSNDNTHNSFHDAQFRTVRKSYLQGTEITSTKEVSSVNIKHSIHHAETKNSQTNAWESTAIYPINAEYQNSWF